MCIIGAAIGAAGSIISSGINAATRPDQPGAVGSMPGGPEITPVANSGSRPLPGLQSRVLSNNDNDERSQLAASILGG